MFKVCKIVDTDCVTQGYNIMCDHFFVFKKFFSWIFAK